jgi:hypothetical protein
MYKNIFIGVVIFLLLLFLFSKSTYIGNTITITKVDTIYSKQEIVKYKKGKDIQFTIIDSVPYPVHIPVHDTIQIISDYSRIYAYNDTINMDSSRFIINDTISQNRIIGRKFNASIAEKTITINNTKIIQPKNAIYVGGDLTSYNGRLEPNIGIGFKMPSGLFMAKYGTLGYSIGYYKKL